MPTVTRWLCAALLVLCAVSAEAQERGRVVSVKASWATNDYGDQRIVTDLEIDLLNGRIVAQVEGGTRDGVTLSVSTDEVLEVGAVVVARRTSRGWRVRRSDEQHFTSTGYRWPGDSEWWLNPSNGDMSDALAEQDAIAAAGAWTVQSTADFAMVFAGSTAQNVQANDGVNIVMFRPGTHPTVPGALGSAHCWWSGGVRVDCDIILWEGAATFVPTDEPCAKGWYLRDILTHEFGHYAGLSHSSVAGATMWPSIGACSTWARSLHVDDIAGIEWLYPSGGQEPEPPSNAFLTATARTSARGVMSTRLAWSGLTTPKIDIHRNGARVVTKTNDGSARDVVPGEGTYVYQVCNYRTTVCTNQASVTF